MNWPWKRQRVRKTHIRVPGVEGRLGVVDKPAKRPGDERDAWIRLFNRLEAAIAHHRKAKGGFADDADDALYAARDRIVRDAGSHDSPPR